MQAIDELTGLVSSKFAVIKSLITMIKLEARLARLSIFPLLLNLLILFVVLITFWTTAIILLGYGISLASNSIFIAIISVFFFNLICLLLLGKYLHYNTKKMSFEKTRQFLAKQNKKESDEFKKKSDKRSEKSRKKITSKASRN